MTVSDKREPAADERHAVMKSMMTDNARTMTARCFLTRPLERRCISRRAQRDAVYCSSTKRFLHASKISSSSATVDARNMAMRVCRKSGMPLKTGLAAKCRRVCKMPRYSSMRATLTRSCSFTVSYTHLTLPTKRIV